MSGVAPELADIDAALAKGEWWLRILDELAEAGVVIASQLSDDVTAGRRRAEDAADDYVRVAAAVREAIAMSVRLEQALRGLTSLRAGTVEEIRAAMARATAETAAAEAAAESAGRAQARAKASGEATSRAETEQRREARRAKVRDLVTEVIDHAAADGEDRENLCLALEERLSFDPAYTDVDSLPLRETVERICADLDIVPDWSRWEAQDWNPPDRMFHGPWLPPRPDDPDDAFAVEPAAPIRAPALVRLE